MIWGVGRVRRLSVGLVDGYLRHLGDVRQEQDLVGSEKMKFKSSLIG